MGETIYIGFPYCYTAQKYTHKELIHLEREPLRFFKGDTRYSLMMDKVTFDEHVHVLERYCKGYTSYTFTKP